MRALVRLLLRLFCSRADREAVEGDLLEILARRTGPRALRDVCSVLATLLLARLRSWRPRGLGRDTLDGWRTLGRQPAFSAAVITTIALGIGANTAVFSLVNAVLLKTMPVSDPGALVLFSVSTDASGLGSSFPFPFYQELRDSSVLDGALCAAGMSPTVDTGDLTERISGELVSPNYFDVLGVRAHVGRLFTDADTPAGGGDRVAVLSYDYWQRRFGGDPAVIGRTIRMNTRPVTIVGVSPPGFTGIELGGPRDIRVPVTLQPDMEGSASRLASAGFWWLQIIGRRRAGVSPDQAERALQAHYAHFLANQGRHEPANRLTLLDGRRGRPTLQTRFRLPLAILSALAALMLVLVCLNVANLMLARNGARQRELAIAIALGAGPGRLVQRLLVEAVLQVAIGTTIGLVLSLWGARLLASIAMPSTGAPLLDIPLDRRVLLFTMITASASALLCGLAPALIAARATPSVVLGSGSRHVTGRMLGRRLLVGAQMGLSLAILATAGLFVRTLLNLQRLDVGFDTGHVAEFTVNPALSGYNTDRARLFYADLPARISALPGVRGATLSVMPLLDVSRWGSGLTLETGEEDNRPGPLRDAVAPGYFRAIGIPIVAGREFDATDRIGAPKVAIVNEAFARRYFGGGPALGRRIGPGGGGSPAEYTIVGVVRDSRVVHVREAASPFWYVPYRQLARAGQMTLHVRTDGDPRATIDAVRGALASIDKGIVPFRERTVTSQIDEQIVAERLLAALAAGFGVIAVMLASIGLYGVLSFVACARTREIGVRMALGATRPSILRLVVWQTSTLVGGGLVAGLVLAWAVARETRTLLFGIDAGDVTTMVGALALVMAVTAAATLLPAAKAARTDPVSALRTSA